VTRADDFAAFCQKMLGSEPGTPLVAPGAGDKGPALVNGAFLSALLDAFKVCCPAERTGPSGANAGSDPLADHRDDVQ